MSEPTIDNIDQWLFDEMEGNLSASQSQRLEEFLLQHPALLEDQSAWQAATLQPFVAEYSDVNGLLKKGNTVWTILGWSVAASIVLSLGAWWLMNAQSAETQTIDSVEIPNWKTPVSGQSDRVETIAKSRSKSMNSDSSSENTLSSSEVIPRTAINQTDLATVQKQYSPNSLKSAANPLNQREPNLRNQPQFGFETNVVKKGQSSQSPAEENLAVSCNTDYKVVPSAKNITDQNQEALLSARNTSSLEPSVEPNSIESQLSTESKTMAWEEVDNLYTQAPAPIHVSNEAVVNRQFEEGEVAMFSTFKSTKAEASKKTMAAHWRTFARKVERMTDNPIALYNSKEQFYHLPNTTVLDANFAAVGDKIGSRVLTNSRVQWPGEQNQQIQNSASYDVYLRSLRGGVGVKVDHAYYANGKVQVGQLAMMYSPKFGLSKNFVLEPAVRFKVGQHYLNRSKIQEGDLIELNRGVVRTFEISSQQSATNNLWYKDLGVGALLNSKWFYTGIQLDNLGQHYNNIYSINPVSDERANQVFTWTAGTDYVSKSKLISFSPYLIYRYTEKISELWGGSLFRYKKFTCGAGYSDRGDMAGSIGWRTKQWLMMYTADFTTSALLNRQVLSHQLMLRLTINNDPSGQRMLKL